MQSITALAHLRAAVVYLVDISEECGYSIAQQAALFHSIKPLFSNKPTLIVCNKVDVRRLEELPDEDRRLVEEMAAEARRISNSGVSSDDDGDEAYLLTMSALQEEGLAFVKQTACDRLLRSRVEMKVQGKRINDIVNRIHMATPKVRDGRPRPPVLPPNLAAKRGQASSSGAARVTEKDMQDQHGGAGVYSADLCKTYQLADEEWKYDIMPEIIDGHNIYDFVDPDIDVR